MLKLAQDRLEIQLKEKELLLKEVHHRMKNNIASISSLLSLKCESCSDLNTVMAISETKYLLASMTKVYEKLIQTGEYQQVSIKQYVEDLLTSIQKAFPQHPSVRIETYIQELILDSKRTMWIGMILNELVTNALKYAFQGKELGRLMITVEGITQKICFSVQDDGIGLSSEIASRSGGGFGLMLVRLLTEQLNGSLKIESTQGTKVTIEFPL